MFYNVKLDSYDPLNTAGWRVCNIPVLTHSTHNRDRFSIPNRDGELLGGDMWRSNAVVTVTFHTRVGDNNWNSNFAGDTAEQRYNRLMNLLTGKSHLHIKIQNKLDPTAWDDAGYYEILDYTITNETRKHNDYIRVEVQIEVYPFKYLEVNSTTEKTTASSIENLYDESMPLYYLNRVTSGAVGNFSLTVNGYTMTGIYPEDATGVYIDTMLQIAYYVASGQKHEVRVNGDYAKLRLPAHYTSTVTGSHSLTTYPRLGEKV